MLRFGIKSLIFLTTAVAGCVILAKYGSAPAGMFGVIVYTGAVSLLLAHDMVKLEKTNSGRAKREREGD